MLWQAAHTEVEALEGCGVAGDPSKAPRERPRRLSVRGFLLQGLRSEFSRLALRARYC